MKMAEIKTKLPQEGTACSASGESLGVPISRPSGPTDSGGGRQRHRGNAKNKNICMSGSDIETNVTDAGTSDGSLQTSRRSRSPRKRTRSGGRSSGGSRLETEADSSGDDMAPKRLATRKPKTVSQKSESARRRGRPPKAGETSGLTKAKEALVASEREKLELSNENEKEIADLIRQTSCRRAAWLALPEWERESTVFIKQRMEDNVAVILKVAQKSGNLKGTYVRSLKDAATHITELNTAALKRTVTEETKLLQEELERLRKENAQIKKEMAEYVQKDIKTEEEVQILKKELAEVKVRLVQNTQNVPEPILSNKNSQVSDQVTEVLIATIMRQVGSMIRAQFESIESRLLPEKRLRPPLAADKSFAEVVATKSTKIVASTSKLPAENTLKASKKANVEPPEKLKKKKKEKASVKKGEEGIALESLSLQKEPILASLPVDDSDSWQIVRKRGTNFERIETKENDNRNQKTKKLRGVKLQAPRTSAVVIAIHDEAKVQGITYQQVIAEAKKKIDISGLGIEAVKIRKTMTGARILEIAGDNNDAHADVLAKKLKEHIGIIHVTRPTKCAELRITGLDESVTPNEVAEVICRVGECKIDSLKIGDIRMGSEGLGACWVRCPVTVAKRLVETGKLLIGWVSAQVKVLETRVLRCFKCQEVGHVRAQCTSDIDRSADCFRCGQIGHKANQCSADPRCSLCLAAKKPAEHKLGSKSCLSFWRKVRKAAGKTPKLPMPLTSTPVREEMANNMSS